MKVLIWFGCALIASIIQLFIEASGYRMGGLGAWIFWGGTLSVISFLTKAWDNHKESKKHRQVAEQAEEVDPVKITCPHCGAKNPAERDLCISCNQALFKYEGLKTTNAEDCRTEHETASKTTPTETSHTSNSDYEIITCPHCGARNWKTREYCTSCQRALYEGAPLNVIENAKIEENCSSEYKKAKEEKQNKQKDQTPLERPAFCRKCGAKLLSDSVFCSMCGTKVIDVNEAISNNILQSAQTQSIKPVPHGEEKGSDGAKQPPTVTTKPIADATTDKNINKQSKKIAIPSVISLVISIIAVVFYYLAVEVNPKFVYVFMILSVVALIMPVVAKKLRACDQNGKGMEIVAIILAGFCFWSFVFAGTSWPLPIGYLGWVVVGFLYKITQ